MRMNRILVIRGGAIGDFILTLPALKALRDAFPRAHIEILGYKHIAALAENRFYARVVRSIEYRPLSSVFTSRLWRFIREAAAKKKTGRWKIGSRCFQQMAISQL